MAFLGFTPPSIVTKAFLLATFIIGLLIQLPIWFFIDLKRENRPRESWDLKRSLFVRLFKHTTENLAFDLGLGLGGNGRDPRVKPADHELKEVKHVWVEPFPIEWVKGEVKEYVERAEVTPVRIGGYWYGRRGGPGEDIPLPGENEKVVMHYHGGAYVRWSLVHFDVWRLT